MRHPTLANFSTVFPARRMDLRPGLRVTASTRGPRLCHNQDGSTAHSPSRARSLPARLPPPPSLRQPAPPAPRRQDGGQTLSRSAPLADYLKWRHGAGPSGAGHAGAGARAAGNGAERGRAGASRGRGSRRDGERVRGEGRRAGAGAGAGGGGGAGPRGGAAAPRSRWPAAPRTCSS